MPSHESSTPGVFVSHSSKDRSFVVRLVHDLRVALGSDEAVWVDQTELYGGAIWEEQIEREMRARPIFLLVLSPDALSSEWVRYEIRLAEMRGKVIIPIRCQECPMPEELARMQNVSFVHTDDAQRYTEAFNRLLHALDIWSQDPATVDTTRIGLFSPLPDVVRSSFRDRDPETEAIVKFLTSNDQRALQVFGRSGIGKTTLIARAVQKVMRDEQDALDYIVYVSALVPAQITTAYLFNRFCQVLPPGKAQRILDVFSDGSIGMDTKVHYLIPRFDPRRMLIIIDDFEQALNLETQRLLDADLEAALCALIDFSYLHRVKLLFLAQSPCKLPLSANGRDRVSNLTVDTLPEWATKDFLLAVEPDLRNAEDAMLHEAWERTEGNPRALMALHQLLDSRFGHVTLADILQEGKGALPAELMKTLIGKVFDTLDPDAQRVMQALAIYNRPVPIDALAFVLEPYLPANSVAEVVERLSARDLVKHTRGRYFLHRTDRAYAISTVERGEPADAALVDDAPFSQYALLRRAANYCRLAWKPETQWKALGDVYWPLAELDLRYESEDYDEAARVFITLFQFLYGLGGASSASRTIESQAERLRENVSDPTLRAAILINLGLIYQQHRGNLEAALGCFEDVASLATQIQHAEFDLIARYNSGNCLQDLGRVKEAIKQYEIGLKVARKLKNEMFECMLLNVIGTCYADTLSRVRRGIAYYERAMKMAEKLENLSELGVYLGNLGTCYAARGREFHATSDHYFLRALSICDRTHDYEEKGEILHSKAEMLTSEGHYAEAITLATDGLRLAEQIGSPRLLQEHSTVLALASLYSGDMSASLTAIQHAANYNLPEFNHYVSLLSGSICLASGDREAARKHFDQGLLQAMELIENNARNYHALDTQWLALCGLILCGAPYKPVEATKVYRRARAINRNEGVVTRTKQLLSVLHKLDAEDLLKPTTDRILGA